MKNINELVAKIKGELSNALKNRIKKVELLENKLAEAVTLNLETPSDENQESVDELNETLITLQDSVMEQLGKVLADEEFAPEPAPIEPAPVKVVKKTKGLGILITALVIGVVTLGAVNIYNNR